MGTDRRCGSRLMSYSLAGRTSINVSGSPAARTPWTYSGEIRRTVGRGPREWVAAAGTAMAATQHPAISSDRRIGATGSLHEAEEPRRHQTIAELDGDLIAPIAPDLDEGRPVERAPASIRLAHDRQHLHWRPALGDLRAQRRDPVIVRLLDRLDVPDLRRATDGTSHHQPDRQRREHDSLAHGCLLAFRSVAHLCHGSRPTAKPTELDVPPPGGGLKTVTCAVPAVKRSVAGIVALNCVAETKVVARAAPFQR